MPAASATATAVPVQLTPRTLYAARVRDEGRGMVRAIIEYESEPDPDRYRQHIAEYASKVACSAFRHGPVTGSPLGEPKYRYYAEFEWDDMTAFEAAASGEAFAASGKDAMEMGIPFTVQFAEIS